MKTPLISFSLSPLQRTFFKKNCSVLSLASLKKPEDTRRVGGGGVCPAKKGGGRISCVCFWKGTLEGGLYLTQSRALRPIINSPRWRWSWTIGAFQWGRGAPVPDPSWPVLQPHCCPAVTSASWAERET